MNPLDSIAQRTVASLGDASKLVLRKGIVTAVGAGTVDITLGDATPVLTGIRHLGQYTPLVDDVVWVLGNEGALLVLGGIVPQAAGDPADMVAFSNVADYGSKIQHGIKTVTTAVASQGTATVTFSSSFASSPTVVCTINAGTSATNQLVRTSSLSVSGFTITIAKRDGSNYTSGSEFVHWVAIG